MANIQYTPIVGKTEGRKFLIDQVVDAVVDGQPYVVVVGRYESHLHQIIPIITRNIRDRGIECKQYWRLAYNCEGTILTFHTAETIESAMIGVPQGRINCQFWDYSALPLWECFQ